MTDGYDENDDAVDYNPSADDEWCEPVTVWLTFVPRVGGGWALSESFDNERTAEYHQLTRDDRCVIREVDVYL